MSRTRFMGRVAANGTVEDVFDGVATAVRSDAPAGTWLDVDGASLTELAAPGTALAELWLLVLREGLDPTFSSAIDAEVAALQVSHGIDDPALVDRTALPVVTIDDARSRDLDQAVFCEQTDDGLVLWYAIADASFYVRPGTALFERSLRRGASFYLPGFALPMLPRALSEDLVSLNADVDRRATLFRTELASDGTVRGTRVERARVRSRGKLSFEAVQAFLDGETAEPAPDTGPSLRALEALGRLRMRAAAERGVARYRRAEVKVEVADEGATFVAMGDLRNDVERYNEQCSLLCNLEGARLLSELDRPDDHVHPVYRVHRPPEPERLAALRRTIDEIITARGLPEDPWRWDADTEPVAAWLARLPKEGVAGRLATALHRQAVMVNVASTYEAEPGPHHGVGGEAYARFSAPMREVVGIFSHQELWEALGQGFTDDERTREAVMAAANRAKNVQKSLDRGANRLVLDARCEALLEGEQPWESATLMGATATRLYVRLDEPPIDLKVYTADLGDVAVSGALVRRDGSDWLVVGDAVEVRVTGRDPRRDRWCFALRRAR